MPTRCQIGIIYFGDDTGEQWKDYWTSLLDRGNKNVSVRSICTQSQFEDLRENFTKSTVVIILLTESMLSYLENEGLKFCNLLQEKSSLVGILCYTKQSKFDKISCGRITNLQSWNMFDASEDPALNKQVVYKVMDLVDKMSERRVTKIRKATVMPSEIRKPDESIAIIFKKEVKGKVEVSFGNDDKRIEANPINVYTHTARLPMKEWGFHKLHIYIDNKIFCHHPLRFVPLGLEAFQCPQFLCQILGVTYTNDLEALDAELVRLYDKSTPKDDSLNTLLGCYARDTPSQRSPHELPTLLHFAASNGLSMFCSMLLDAPGSLAAYQIENKDGKDPAELAESAGHTELANYLRTFIETEAVVQECDDIYIEMKGRSIYENLNHANPTEEDEVPDLQTFKKRPYDVRTRRHSEPTPSTKTNPPLTKKMPSAEEFMFGEPKEISKTCTLSGSRTQDELIELAKAVKDREFTMDEAERLYESWKARNHNSSYSIKERQTSLEALRQEYGKVIEVVKAKRGETGVFKKLKKKLVKKVSNRDIKISKPIGARPAMTLPLLPSQTHRLSSSSNSSRDSFDSQGAIYGYGSESDDLLEEDEDSSDNQKFDLRPKSTSALSAKKKRQSFREQYMESFNESRSEDPPEVPPRKHSAPPVPPRTYRQLCMRVT